MYWDKVLNEVLLDKKSSQLPKVRFTNIGTIETNHNTPSGPTNQLKQKSLAVYKHKNKNYDLGPKYDGVYFTKREAECMTLLLKGKTINKTAVILNLSPRTIEFYLKNMKAKLGCRTKFELVELVLESDFLRCPDLA